MKKLFVTAILFLSVLCSATVIQAQSRTKASVDFSYLPDAGEDRYNQRIAHKTIPVGQDDFLILSRKAADTYTVEKYSANLKKTWEEAIPLQPSETVEAFFTNKDAAIVITRRDNGQGSQQLFGHRINLATGKKQQNTLLLEAPAKARRAGIASSADGSKLLVFRYQTTANQQIQKISGTLYDGNLSKLSDTNYDLSDTPAILSADVQVNNSGDQFISLISDNMNRLTVRLYKLNAKEAKVMSVLVGGVFDGQKVYIIDSKFNLMPQGSLYGAVLTANQQTSKYYSLKAVKFDFEAEDMVFAEEFKFTPDYLAKINTLDKSSGPKPQRLEDIYLSDLYLTPEQKLVVLAEKKYVAGGKDSPYFAKELHLFAYDEYMNSAWNSVLMKNQEAPAEEAFSGISYAATLQGKTLHLLTLENLNGKHDLYLRQIDTSTGTTTAPKAVGLKVANDTNLAYVKDFTSWLSEKDIITVVRPNRKADGLRLSHIQLK
ncbi:hypothetical protein [Pontibacter harenae]|uniref:hypothetical protein n=1 Tax=Pontibacter harenae TaxID=2894083 RepID=UPI001E618B11|nr:hypothetical protein [Pontibacter harenae]MCC9168277.1 hypothetical protein [Pontibacter harenae]